VQEFSVLSRLAGVDVDGCIGLVVAGSKEDLQGLVGGLQGHVGLVDPRAAARGCGWGRKGHAVAGSRCGGLLGRRIRHPRGHIPLAGNGPGAPM